jgi:hypothetical protein
MQTEQSMQLVTFPAGSIVELDDPLSGATRLGLVTDRGTEFVEYIDDLNPPTPLAILDVFDPKLWGDCRALAAQLMFDGEEEKYKAFNSLLLELCDTAAGADVLTLNRAAKWAFETNTYDLEQAAEAGLNATADARARQLVIGTKAAQWIAAGVV